MSNQQKAIGVLVLLSLVIFAQSLNFALIQLDDPKHIWENPNVNTNSVAALSKIWEGPYFGLYIPVTYSLWAGAVGFSKLMTQKVSPSYLHMLNVLVHSLNGILLFLLLMRLFIREKELTPIPWKLLACFLGAALFIVHPVQVQSVGWISCFKDLAVTCFSLFALLYTADFCEGNGRFPWKAGMFFLLALLSKPSAVVLPVLCFGIAVIFYNLPWKKAAPLFLSWLLVSLAFVIFTKSLQPNEDLPFLPPYLLRPLVAMDAIGFYLLKLFFPYPLSLDYGRMPKAVMSHLWLQGLWLIPIFAGTALWLYRKQFPKIVFGFIFMLLTLTPVLGFVPFLFQMFSTVTDHYLYFGIVGISLALTALLIRLPKPAPYALTGILLSVFAIHSATHLRIWKDGVGVFGHAVQLTPTSLVAHNNLGVEHQSRGNFPKAAIHFQKALDLAPERSDLYSNLGAALVASGEVAKGITFLHLAETKEKPTPVAAYNLARAYLRLGKYDKASFYAKRAQKMDPKHFGKPDILEHIRGR